LQTLTSSVEHVLTNPKYYTLSKKQKEIFGLSQIIIGYRGRLLSYITNSKNRLLHLTHTDLKESDGMQEWGGEEWDHRPKSTASL